MVKITGKKREISDLLNRETWRVIAIDGELGAGKTLLSDELSRRYQVRVIHVDDYLKPGMNAYLAALKLEELVIASEDKGPIIFDGVCLLSVLAKLGIEPDIHFFLHREHTSPYKKGSRLVSEVAKYIESMNATNIKADQDFSMNSFSTNQLDVDIAYLKSKTIVSVMLALGGIISLLVGAFILSTGVSSNDSAVFEIMGAKLTAEGIGAVILGSSVFWAYFSYLSRPKYSRRKELKSSVAADGTREEYEFEAATMISASQQGNHDLL